ncbi:putative Dol-P-Man:Man(7)GlcNAc(2)-PP-Dol alpha-1,6-mannosyltransferase [Amphibalanus amphitrite]|uniref:Mannosyltransferase n=1 Tax=Amphibalanus amphitrite TaxID=1232801 RepID=A0A6A4VPH3_AMPAM|nr:putative Dol-P-Man:Man(7)GlcNAc(2)-PP-Dol alpha-1,6-mannosyltransferase [Amphibalanus amphitrite]
MTFAYCHKCAAFAIVARRLFAVRFVLGAVSVAAFYRFRQSVEQVFGRPVAVWLVCITVTQFHFMFYLSRALPNMMAMPLVLMAVSCWMRQEHTPFLWWSGAAVLLFRAELTMLLGILLLMELVTGRLPLLRCLKVCILAGLALLLLSFTVDSLFWRRPVWPEGEVLWFNVVLNKSAEWGTLPALWYWYSALPRALGASLALVPVGLALDRRARLLAGPALAFVALYSLLPHKELRFIIYVVPLLNVAAARACHAIWEGRLKSAWRSYLATAMCCHLLANVALTALLAAVARHNYPGGAALGRLQHLEPDAAYVHIDVYSAQTGVTRFLQHRDDWRYNKTENLAPGSPDMHSFTHLLIEARGKRSSALKPYEETHMILDSVDVFSHIQFNYDHFPPLRLRMRPAIFLLYNNVPENVRWPKDEEEPQPPPEESEKVVEPETDDVKDPVAQEDASEVEEPKAANDEIVFTGAEESDKDYSDDMVASEKAAELFLPPDDGTADEARLSDLPAQVIR